MQHTKLSIKNIISLIDENTFFISDLHLGHKNILKFEPVREEAMIQQGYSSHDDFLIHQWNSVISKDDVVVCVGDMAFNNIEGFSKRLNGNKILVLGNHDRKPYHEAYNSWTVIDGIYIHEKECILKIQDTIQDDLMSALLVWINGNRYLISHYPVYDENQYDRRNKNIVPRMHEMERQYQMWNCDFNIHGHTHSASTSFDKCINVCVEHMNFKPQRLKDIINETTN